MKIDYKIKINKGLNKGAIIIATYDIEEIECNGLALLLIDDGYIDSLSNNDFKVLERSISE